ncbi:MAG TPA: OmpH family outer membrane protein [Chitinophagales bacterium]|nr:OmpH family outer membrane protein [Chitinophagales bacterium]
MKKILAIAAIITLSFTAQAQKVAYVDVDYVLKNIPEYNDAQKQLDAIAATWQKEIDAKYAEIDKLYKQYQAEQVLLTEEMKQTRQKEIQDKEKSAKDLQKQRFGYQGDLFEKRQELVQPIQDKVYDAIQKIATTKGYDFVLDKSSGSVVLYANTKMNISDQVLTSMGINPKAQKAESEPPGDNKQTGDNKQQPPVNKNQPVPAPDNKQPVKPDTQPPKL